MNNKGFSKLMQIHDLFIEIINPINCIDISFGYMRVFKNNNYYTIVENLQCLLEFIKNIKQSSVFCERNITSCFDESYNFTLWPKEPKCTAMSIYYKYEIWNGVTITKKNNQYIELYWFTPQKIDVTRDHYKFFIRNKKLLMEFIKYFDNLKRNLYIPENEFDQNLFTFEQGFDSYIPESNYIKKEWLKVNKAINLLNLESNHIDYNEKKLILSLLSPRESEIFAILSCGYTAKAIAIKLDLSVNTVRHHIEHIKSKLGIHSKDELIKLAAKDYTKQNKFNI